MYDIFQPKIEDLWLLTNKGVDEYLLDCWASWLSDDFHSHQLFWSCGLEALAYPSLLVFLELGLTRRFFFATLSLFSCRLSQTIVWHLNRTKTKFVAMCNWIFLQLCCHCALQCSVVQCTVCSAKRHNFVVGVFSSMKWSSVLCTLVVCNILRGGSVLCNICASRKLQATLAAAENREFQ